MTKFNKSVVLLALFAGLTGCVPTQQQLRMEMDLAEMKKRLARSEMELASLKSGGGGPVAQQIASVARSQADLQATVDTLKVEFQSVNGRFEDQNRTVDEVRDEISLIRDDLGLKVSAIEDRLSQLETAPKAAATTPAPAQNPDQHYQQAVQAILAGGDYAGARDSLKQFLREAPDHKLAVNATYWIGEAFYGEKKYENAILQFQDVIQKFPKHTKAAAAMLKQGLAFQALGDKQNAQVILEKLIETYPQAEEAGKAKERLAGLAN